MTTTTPPTEKLTKPFFNRDRLQGLAVPGALVVLIVVFSILSPTIFFSATNFRVLISGQAIVLLLALAATIPLRSGDFDLTISAVMVIVAVTIAILGQAGVPAIPAALIGILLGLVIGGINAFFIVILDIDGLIVSLGMLTILSGLTLLISKGSIVSGIPLDLQAFAGFPILGLPVVVWIGWLLALVIWYVFEFTPVGRYMLFIGGNRSTSKLAGLRVDRIRIMSLLASGVIAAIAGVLMAGILGAVDPSSGHAYLLAPFTAAFLGASAIQVGRFNSIGTVVGIYLLAVGISGLQLLGLFGWINDVFNGACLIAAVAFARALRKKAS